MKYGRLWVLAAGMVIGMLPAFSATPEERAAEWVQAHLRTNTAPPFSFIYDGRPFSEIEKAWEFTEESKPLDGARIEHNCRYRDPETGLTVRCVGTEYRDFPAVEWVVYLRNDGKKDTPLLESIQAMDTDFSAIQPTATRLYYARGSRAEAPDFEPLEAALEKPLTIAPAGGRSSDTHMPFFNLALSDTTGVMLAVGWSGQWAARFSKEEAVVNARAGMEETHLRLHPGEEIRTPAMLLLFWAGEDRLVGHNQFRRLLLAHYTPQPGGRPPQFPLAASPHGIIGFTDTTEANMLEGIRNITEHEFPADTFWIDAGWHGKDSNWAKNPGTWTANPEHFPKGLKPVADAAHAAGMRFLLWVEPERVMKDTWLYENHRDWLLAPADLPKDLQYQKNDGFYLLNFGNPEALAWAKETFITLIRETGIDIYRQDFNMTPLYFWRNGEEEDRRGMNEIRYIEGFYDFWDTLQREFPDLLLDSCASGGRRIDFEVMRRALTLFRSDLCWEPLSEQSMNYGISFWMPITGIGAVTMDPYAFQSGIGSHISLALDYYRDWSWWAPAKAAMQRYQALRPLFTGDYYPQTPYSLAKDRWIAWQYHQPEKGEGLIQAFRREECAETGQSLRVRGLDPAADYVIELGDGTPEQTLSGAVLMQEGLPVTIAARPGSLLIHYRRALK